MPLDTDGLNELKVQIGNARKGPVNFGLALGKKAEDTALIMHKIKAADVLYRQARKAEGVDISKSCSGTVTVDGSVITFACDIDPPSGMKKKCKEFLSSNKLTMSVKILAPGGAEFEAGDAPTVTTGAPSGDQGGGERPTGGDVAPDPAEAWETLRAKVEPLLNQALADGKGDLSKMRAVWALATEKAAGEVYAAAIQAANVVLKLIAAAADAPKTEAQEGSGQVVSDTLNGKALLEELKAKGEAIKTALEVLPRRVADSRQLAADVVQGVKDNALDAARTALGKLDQLIKDAAPVAKAKSDYQQAEGRIASRAQGLNDVPPDNATLKPLLEAYQKAAEAAVTAASDQDWIAARGALPEWVRTLTVLEKAWQGMLDVEGQYKLAARELGERGDRIRDLDPKAPGHDALIKALQKAVTAALDQADLADWTKALAAVPAWRSAIEAAEKAHADFAIRKARFDKLYEPLKGPLAEALKLGAVTPAIGVMLQEMRTKLGLLKPAEEARDYATAIPLAEDLADLVPRILEARRVYVAQRTEYAAQSGAVASKFDAVEGCGPLDPALDLLKTAFDLAVAAMRNKAKVNDWTGALADLEDVTKKADAFLKAKATRDTAREEVFEETRQSGRDEVPVLPSAGKDDGLTIGGIEAAMEKSNSLRTSKGLQDLLQETRLLDDLYGTVMASSDMTFAQGSLTQFQRGIDNCLAYQREHKKNATFEADRNKFAEAEKLVEHLRSMVADIVELVPVLKLLHDIDPVALVGNEAGALRALGVIEGLKAANLNKEAKDLAEKKRRTLVANMLKVGGQTADQRREVLMMAGGEFKESYDRQMAMGPLTKTADESRVVRDHAATMIQPPKDAENVDKTRKLAERLITEDGRLELAALYACDPEELAGDSPSSRQTARALVRLREDPEAIELLENIQAPKKGSPAAKLVCATLGLKAGTEVTAAMARQAALASLMAELRQKDVGSCFATQVAANVHDTDPKTYLKDMSDMLSKGAITRTVNGKLVTMPVEARMSDAALNTSTITLSRADDPILLGSTNGGGLDPAKKTKLGEAPAFQASFTALGINPDDREAAMEKALKAMQASDAFKTNQNEKALLKAVATIGDEARREAVLKAARAQLSTNGGDVKKAVALEMAMAGIAADGDRAKVRTATEQRIKDTGATLEDAVVWAMADQAVVDAEAATRAGAAQTALAAFDEVGAAADFQVEPGLVIRQLAMDKVGLTEAEMAKQAKYEAAAAALAKDTRLDSDPERRKDLKALETLQNDCASIRPKIMQMQDLKDACYDAYTGGEDNRLLRAYEYTLTAMAEASSVDTNLKNLQLVEGAAFQEDLTEIVTNLKADVGITAPNATLDDIGTKLFARYQTLFKEGTKHAFDASLKSSKVSADGSSSRGGFYLYDIRGISSPEDWIKVDDQKKYAALVHGTVMLAWKEEFGSEPDDLRRETARLMAEKMAAHVGTEKFAKKTAEKGKAWGGEDTMPWQKVDGGYSQAVLEVLNEKAPTITALGPSADSEALMRKLGAQLKTVWNADADLRSAAAKDPEVATVNGGNDGVHAFSLLPGDPKMRAIVESPNVDTAINSFKTNDKAKWDGLLDEVLVTSKDEARRLMAEYRMPNTDDWMDYVWPLIENGTHPATVKGLIAASRSGHAPGDIKGFDTSVGAAVAANVIPPVAAADLQKKLDKVAKQLGVPDDLIAVVTKRAKDALDLLDPAKAKMAAIKAEIAKAMTAEGMDGDAVSQAQVNAALREPPGIIFADSNWGNAEHRTKYAMVVNPANGAVEMWQMNEDGSNAYPMDEDGWVKMNWNIVT